MQDGVRALHAHRLLMRLSLAMANVFVWVFLFEYFAALSASPSRAFLSVAIVYSLSQAVTVLLTPISAAHLSRGVRKSMIAGTVVLGASFVVLGAALDGTLGGAPTLWPIMLFAFLFGAYRALYWVPYRIQEAMRGEPVAVVLEFIVALMPALAGAAIVTTQYGVVRVLYGAAAFLAVSLVPVYSLPDIRENYAWHYLQAFGEVFAPRHRALLVHGLLDGMQSAALFLVWPLAVFLIVGASYVLLGAVMSVTLVFLMLLRRPYQMLVQRLQLEDSVTLQVTLAVSGWVFRLAAGSPVGIIFADSYSHLGTPHGRAAGTPLTEQAADASSFIDEYSSLKEISLALGRITLSALFALFVFILPLPAALAGVMGVAAIAAGAAVLLARRLQFVL